MIKVITKLKHIYIPKWPKLFCCIFWHLLAAKELSAQSRRSQLSIAQRTESTWWRPPWQLRNAQTQSGRRSQLMRLWHSRSWLHCLHRCCPCALFFRSLIFHYFFWAQRKNHWADPPVWLRRPSLYLKTCLSSHLSWHRTSSHHLFWFPRDDLLNSAEEDPRIYNMCALRCTAACKTTRYSLGRNDESW